MPLGKAIRSGTVRAQKSEQAPSHQDPAETRKTKTTQATLCPPVPPSLVPHWGPRPCLKAGRPPPCDLLWQRREGRSNHPEGKRCHIKGGAEETGAEHLLPLTNIWKHGLQYSTR